MLEELDPGQCRELRLQLRALSLYRGVLEDEPGRRVRRVLDFLGAGEGAGAEDAEAAVDAYGQLCRVLLMEDGAMASGDPWQAHLRGRVLSDSNPFSAAAERSAGAAPPDGLLARASAELGVLRRLHDLSLARLRDALHQAYPAGREALGHLWGDAPAWSDNGPAALDGIDGRLASAVRWAEMAEPLYRHYWQTGTGLFSRYRALRWVVSDGAGRLEGIPEPDPVTVEELVGYEREQEVVLRNTRHFVHGAPGNNVLLYGDSGTGKSSLVKALLSEFGDCGLRLVEVPKEHLGDFPYIARQFRHRRERFILFVDDFSFEEHETEYKALKAVLEGSIEARPENVLVYATSNRRHLVKEQFTDRPAPATEEVHPFETVQEKLSLADRFGIRVAFLAPDQERYLAIVEALARRRGIEMERDRLRQRALQWAQWQNGFSGRTARHFVDDLVGEIAEREARGERAWPQR